jgi:hypothetical protein
MLYEINSLYGIERKGAYELSVKNILLTCLEEL